jgi:hypothetical protein
VPHDATAADVAERVLAALARRGVVAACVAERELARGVPWLPPELAAWGRRPDGVLVLPEGRAAIEVDTTQHGARALAAKVAAYREAFARGVYHCAWWFAAPGGQLAAVEQALRVHGTEAPLAARALPAGVTLYR